MMLIAAASRPEAKRLLPGKTGPADAGHTLFHSGRRGPSRRKQLCPPSIPGGRVRQTGTAAAETSPTRKPQPHRGDNRRSPQSRRLLRHGRSRPATPGTRRCRKRTKPARTIQPNIPARRRESAVVSNNTIDIRSRDYFSSAAAVPFFCRTPASTSLSISCCIEWKALRNPCGGIMMRRFEAGIGALPSCSG